MQHMATPTVALESTVITHGLPFPHNLAIARLMEAEVQQQGAIPATIGVIAGNIVVGLDDAQLEQLARSTTAHKLSRRDLPVALAQQWDGGTTVAATMAIARRAGISVFATGGIGGVHRGYQHTLDISADLTELARTPVLVVCAGAKAILDLPATLEYLETQSVPIMGYQTDEFPAFYSQSSGMPIPACADSPAEVAAIWRAHRVLGNEAGMLLCVPPPAESALPRAEVEAAIGRALQQAERAGVRGPAVTPFLLAAMAKETHGESITTNTALLRQNARVAAQVAVVISQQ
ncbi:MAG: pseudouridine-5'-phosphate glycosidase [Chloroflexaceae bacterium]|nr:pseudouridine-5'-phosphate glycosidase [Chloroflexaceae bacterium]NJO06744.1 pseudouridine-5'-phosphate glycosidase [Chloroflexaceae bacterium]